MNVLYFFDHAVEVTCWAYLQILWRRTIAHGGLYSCTIEAHPDKLRFPWVLINTRDHGIVKSPPFKVDQFWLSILLFFCYVLFCVSISIYIYLHMYIYSTLSVHLCIIHVVFKSYPLFTSHSIIEHHTPIHEGPSALKQRKHTTFTAGIPMFTVGCNMWSRAFGIKKSTDPLWWASEIAWYHGILLLVQVMKHGVYCRRLQALFCYPPGN